MGLSKVGVDPAGESWEMGTVEFTILSVAMGVLCIPFPTLGKGQVRRWEAEEEKLFFTAESTGILYLVWDLLPDIQILGSEPL